MSGVMLSENILAIQAPTQSPIENKMLEDRTRAATENANFSPRETALVENHPAAGADEEEGDKHP